MFSLSFYYFTLSYPSYSIQNTYLTNIFILQLRFFTCPSLYAPTSCPQIKFDNATFFKVIFCYKLTIPPFMVFPRYNLFHSLHYYQGPPFIFFLYYSTKIIQVFVDHYNFLRFPSSTPCMFKLYWFLRVLKSIPFLPLKWRYFTLPNN